MNIELGIDRQGTAAGMRPASYARPVFAALDLGTNNCRLLVAKPLVAGGFRVIDAFSRIVRLGEGVSRTRMLSEAAMERSLAALRICAAKLERRGVTAVRAVATEACRRAENCDDFIDLVERETGIPLDIISTHEEARLALAGCAPLLDPAVRNALVFDIGGGSTELMWLELGGSGRPRMIDQISVPQGVVGLTESYGGDRVSASTYVTMVDEIAEALAAFEGRNGIRRSVERGEVQMLGTSGTVTTLAGIHLGLQRYERSVVDGSYLQIDHARAVSRRLLELDFAGRAAYPCIGRERADLVVAGCAVLEAICDTWPVTRLRIADRGLREGILVDLIAANGA
ncbi:Ppx/GppA phosphatase family protein [Skermanella pratensis]|uniref:Ppx/GppA phosphatase family protein n=1 Tax=Skermanella pratensis TaxID=2233999 RepID=UPI001300CF5B|nr:Ppx/GppA phosphatase family protein [Skermanella pratensis]